MSSLSLKCLIITYYALQPIRIIQSLTAALKEASDLLLFFGAMAILFIEHSSSHLNYENTKYKNIKHKCESCGNTKIKPQ